jgi:proprotein convertase subtilisin/kexin type 5
VCSGCNGRQILNLVDNRCVDRCPSGTSILDNKKNQCRPCDPKCLTCLDKVDFCTSCAKNLLLNVKTGVCSGACSSDKRQVSVNGLCVPCSPNCATCINVPDSCLSCSVASGNILNDFKCVSKCPSGYEVYSKTNQCVISGLRCPFGN